MHIPNPDAAARYAVLVLQHRATPVAEILAAGDLIGTACAGLLASRHTNADIATRLRASIADASHTLDDPDQDVSALSASVRHRDGDTPGVK